MTIQDFIKKYGTSTASLLIERVCEQAGPTLASNGARAMAEELREALESESRASSSTNSRWSSR